MSSFNIENDVDVSKIKKLSDLSKDFLLTLAIGYLGGIKKKVYTEEITMKAFEWNPIEFSWSIEKFQKFPEKEAARRPLLNARDKYELISGAYARDLLKDGWRLTKKGVQLYEKLSYLLDSKPHQSKLSKKEISLLKKQIKQKKLYKNFLINSEIAITTYDLAEFLEATPDNIYSLRRNFFSMYRDIEYLEDNQVDEFFLQLINKFPEILNEKDFIQDQKVREKSKV